MKKYILYIVMIVLMMASFFMSGLFFLNSDLVDFENGIDNQRSIEILAELDSLPMIRIDAYDIIFHTYGELTGAEDNEIEIVSYSGDKEVFEYDGNLSEIELGDKVRVYYTYLERGGKDVFDVEKVLQLEDVVDFQTCVEYGGRVYYDFPRKCVLGQVTFTQNFDDIEERCEYLEGEWIDDFNECEEISDSDCYYLGGRYFRCESACRNEPVVDSCVERCIQVCKFN